MRKFPVASFQSLRGQSLFEVIVALTVVSFIMVGLIEVATLSIRNTTHTKHKAQANSYADELSEWLRGERDAGWSTFESRFNSNLTYCFSGLNWNIPSACTSSQTISGTNFRRSAVFSCYSSAGLPASAVACSSTTVKMVQAIITVSWTEGSLSQSVDVTTNLTNSKSQ